MHTGLTYNIADGRLSGLVDGVRIDAHAGSGGRAGSKTPYAANYFLANNPLAPHVKAGGDIFGPLPQGRFRLQLHESRPNWIRLIADRSNIMLVRDGFAIHGRGAVGSHGCIVPDRFDVVRILCKILKQRHERGQEAPTLQVVAVGQDLDRKFNTA